MVYIAEYSLIMRSSMLDERYADYLTTARAKGLRDDLVLRRHAMPNALLPTVTLFFLSLGFVVSGAITVETVFSWPGPGPADVRRAAWARTSRCCRGCSWSSRAGVILMNLVADLLYPVLDPRVRLMTATRALTPPRHRPGPAAGGRAARSGGSSGATARA